ncbi:MAG: M23 family metallopeptidase [Acetatifactor sp.]|nr:M23 family metallopeptidase [Acetatifactor sp.]
MKKYSRRSLRNIQAIVQDKTGVVFTTNRKLVRHKTRQMALIAGCLLCFAMLCAFAYAKFSDLNCDVAGFSAAYQGDGRFEIVVINYSDKELKLQDNVRVMQWSTSKDVEGDSEKIMMSDLTIAPHSQGIVIIDISEGYDVGAMEENLQEGDWYYFILTNNNFAFGQDWMCSFDFEREPVEDAEQRLTALAEQRAEGQYAAEKEYITGELIYSDWIWPTVSHQVSGSFGEQSNGTYSDHINIAGTAGDEIYAVADGVVTETGFESLYGNFIIVDLGDGIMVKYGHLQEIKVSEGDEIIKGQVIAALGQTGRATSPNMSFAVTIDGEEVNPLITQ